MEKNQQKINRLFFLLCLFCISYSNCFSQNIYFSKSYNSNGKPVEPSTEWTIRPSGLSLYIIFNEGTAKIDSTLLYLFIDKKTDGDFQPFDSKAVTLDPKKDWFAYNYHFMAAGTYNIYVLDSQQHKLAENKITIKQNEASAENTPANKYYENCKMVFCQKIVMGKPYAELKSIDIKTVPEPYIYLNNEKPFNTNVILVQIWKKKNHAFEYDDYVGSKKFSVESDWDDTYFPYKFDEPGDYKVSVFNSKEILIKSSYITVN